MRCRAARTAILDAESAALTHERKAALSRHLSGCAACRTERRMGCDLRADLAALRGEAPLQIDIAPRVMARLAAIDPVRHEDVPTRELAWAALTAGIGALLLGWAFIEWLPGVGRFARAILVAAGSIGSAVLQVVEPLGAMLAAPFKLLGSLLRWIAPYLADLQPLAIGTAAACTAGMVVTITLILGRDLRRGFSLTMREDN
jgi:hypothetical protein